MRCFRNCNMAQSLIQALITWHLTYWKILLSSFLLFKWIQNSHAEAFSCPSTLTISPPSCILLLVSLFIQHDIVFILNNLLVSSPCGLSSLVHFWMSASIFDGLMMPASLLSLLHLQIITFSMLTLMFGRSPLKTATKQLSSRFRSLFSLWCFTETLTSWYCAKADPFHADWYFLYSLTAWEPQMFSVSNRETGPWSLIWGTLK